MYYIIYQTTNVITNMKYIGCHMTENVEDGYMGSGVRLKRAIKKYGKENFQTKILCFCENIEDMIEKESQFVNSDWVERSDTYNLQTGGLSYGILSEESKKKISKSVSEAHVNGLYDYSKLKGKKSWCKGKTGIFSENALKSMSEKRKGVIPHNKGKKTGNPSWNSGKEMGPMKEEQKHRISKTLKEKYAKEDHHLKGKSAHNKGKKTGKPSWNSGLKLEKNIICPHCGKLGGSLANMNRWHFDNCKTKVDN